MTICRPDKGETRRKQITEEMGIHKEWYKEAHKVKMDNLMDFINHLLNDYWHDYGFSSGMCYVANYKRYELQQ